MLSTRHVQQPPPSTSIIGVDFCAPLTASPLSPLSSDIHPATLPPERASLSPSVKVDKRSGRLSALRPSFPPWTSQKGEGGMILMILLRAYVSKGQLCRLVGWLARRSSWWGRRVSLVSSPFSCCVRPQMGEMRCVFVCVFVVFLNLWSRVEVSKGEQGVEVSESAPRHSRQAEQRAPPHPPDSRTTVARIENNCSFAAAARVIGASVANVDDLVLDGVAANSGAGVNSVHMVHAAAGGILLDDSDTHFE
ncbi:hypothetical protein IWZ00DRAFT_23222 [Phyllosticta capitalensis]